MKTSIICLSVIFVLAVAVFACNNGTVEVNRGNPQAGTGRESTSPARRTLAGSWKSENINLDQLGSYTRYLIFGPSDQNPGGVSSATWTVQSKLSPPIPLSVHARSKVEAWLRTGGNTTATFTPSAVPYGGVKTEYSVKEIVDENRFTVGLGNFLSESAGSLDGTNFYAASGGALYNAVYTYLVSNTSSATSKGLANAANNIASGTVKEESVDWEYEKSGTPLVVRFKKSGAEAYVYTKQ